jgi:pimeloyl-ACP methyl ester carboxylesterase
MKRVEEGHVPSFDGTQIYYRAEGEGIPLVVCNGVLCSSGYWEYFRRFFRNRCRVVVWDYRGHGDSEIPTHLSRISIQDFCRDLRSVLDRLGIEKAVLLGHSMGVQVILEFYRMHPESVAALVPVCGTSAHAFRTFYGMPLAEKVVPPILRIGERHADDVARVLRPLLRTWLPDPVARLSGSIHWYLCPREIMEDYFRHMASLDFRVAARALLAMEGHGAEDVLETIQVPTLLIAGELDRMTPLWVMEKMWRTIPGAEFLVIPKGTHTALVENPLLMNLRIELFLRDHFHGEGYSIPKALGTEVRALPVRKMRGQTPAGETDATMRSAGGGTNSNRRAKAKRRERVTESTT